MYWEYDVFFVEKYLYLMFVVECVCLDSCILICVGGVVVIELVLKIIEDEYGKDLILIVCCMCLIDDRQNVVGVCGNFDVGVIGNVVVVCVLVYIDMYLFNFVDLDDCVDRVNVLCCQFEWLFK